MAAAANPSFVLGRSAVVLRRLPRTAALDGVDLFRRLDVAPDKSLVVEPERVDAVVEQLRKDIGDTLKKATSVRGWRAQAMFASLVVALDGCELMTFIDTGEIYYDGDHLKPADYFLALRDGRRIVVDVKDPGIITAADLKKPIKLSESERRRLQRFAALYGVELFVACFIEAMAIWLLLPIDAFARQEGGSYAIHALDALRVNEMGILGDMTIGVIAPLRIEVYADPRMPSLVDNDGNAEFTPGKQVVSTGAGEITEFRNQQIVKFMIRFGAWEREQTGEISEDRIEKIVLTANPPEDLPDQYWGIVGSLSQMYVRYFDSNTRNESGVTALDMTSMPEMRPSLIPHDFESEELPLLRLVLAPPGPA